MPVTLAQARLDTLDDIQSGVIDTFRRNSALLDAFIFDDAVTPGTNSGTLTYGYQRLTTMGTAAFRAFNSEYTAQEPQKTRYTVDLKPFGGKFGIDRVFTRTGGLVDELAFQIEQKAKSTRTLFSDTLINGDTGVDANAFDGLNKALVGTDTEVNATDIIDLSTTTAIDANYKKAMDLIFAWFAAMGEVPNYIAVNRFLKAKIQSVAQRCGYYERTKNDFGQVVELVAGVMMEDIGDKPSSASPIIAIQNRTVATVAQTGLTDMYAMRIAMDGLHGVSLAGQGPIQTYLPDMTLPGAVKEGEVEMVAAIALRHSRAAAVLRNFKVQ